MLMVVACIAGCPGPVPQTDASTGDDDAPVTGTATLRVHWELVPTVNKDGPGMIDAVTTLKEFRLQIKDLQVVSDGTQASWLTKSAKKSTGGRSW